MALVPYLPPAHHTHQARYQVERRYVGGYEYDILGSVLVDVGSDRDMRKLIELDQRMNFLLTGQRVVRVMIALNEAPTRRMSDIQRFRRKMGTVLRAYEEEKAKVLAFEYGLFVDDEMRRLDRQLDETWAKAFEIYGCTKADYFNTTA